jgi:PAS domain S-box-containing protein
VEAVIETMKDFGIDATLTVESGQLTVATKRDSYLKEGYFDPKLMIEFLVSEVQKAKAEGYTALRVTGEMTWALGDDSGVERLIEYEYLLNDFFPENECLAICQYNRKRFSPEIIIDVIRTHPIVIYRDAVVHNYFFEPTDEILHRTDSENKLQRMLEAIKVWERFEKVSGEEELKHKAAFELNPGAISISTFDDGIFLEFNDNFSSISGYDADELIGKSAFETGLWFDRIEGLKLRELLKQFGTVRNYEFCTRKKSGELGWVMLSAALIDYAGKVCILAQSFDITEKVKTEKTIKNQSAFLQTLIDNVPLPLFYKDASGIYTGCNSHFEEYMGMLKKDIIGKNVYDISPKHLADKYREKDEELITNPGLQEYEAKVKGTDGKEHDVIFNKATFESSEGGVSGLIGTITDITDIRRIENELRAKTEDLDRFFTSSLDLLCIANTDGYFLRLNPMWSEVLGYPLDELEGKLFLDLVHPEDMPATLEAVKELETGKTAINFVNRYRCKNGSWRWLEWRSFPYGNKIIYAAARDITQRVNAENALRQSEERYRIISENTGDVIWTMDPASAEFTYVSPSVLRLRGFAPEEIMAQKLEDVLTPESLAVFIKEFPAAIAAVESGDENAKVRLDYVDKPHKDGSIVHTEVVSTFLTDDNGMVNLILGVSRDITERIMVQEKIQQVQKLESLGVLAGGIAHDFNNLLTVILGNIDLSLMSMPEDSKVAQNLKSAEKACISAADLTRQMLAYAGKGQFFVQDVFINEVIAEIGMVMSSNLSKKVSIKYDFKKDIPFITADPGQLKQLVMNLVMNASEAIGDNEGDIKVVTGIKTAGITNISGILLAENLNTGSCIFIKVSDTGCGMDEDMRLRIFDPFYSTKFTGRGLGLAAVLGIVRSMGGAIKVQSEPGSGSVFTLYLPVSADALAAREREREDLLKTVLLVDDEEDVIEIGTQMLKALEFKAVVARNGREALEIIKRDIENDAGKISFVLLDIGMPVMDGEEAFDEINKIAPDLPVFISSGYGEEDVEKRFSGKKVAGFLHKPYKVNTLKKALDEILS